MNNELTQDVFAMVSEFTGVRSEKLTSTTTLFCDLGIDGDDAIEFFEEFGRTFRVDLTELNIENHFGPEGSNPFTSTITWVQGWWTVDHHRAAGVVPISLQDLVKAAQAGRWVKDHLPYADRVLRDCQDRSDQFR